MDTYENTVIEINNEKIIIIWNPEVQSFVAMPITSNLMEEVQLTAENAEDHIQCTSLSQEPANIAICNISEKKISEDSQAASWKDEYAVKKLINLWKTNEALFKSSKIRNEVVWRQIATELQKTNSSWIYTGTQCENKFKDVRKNYVKVKDHNANSTGGERNTCKFYEEMEEVLGDKPCIKPVAIASTLHKRPSSSFASDSNDYPTSVFSSTSEDEEIKEGAPPRRRSRIERSLAEWATSIRQDSQQKEMERERRHKERLEKQEKAIATYRELMSKLLDKL